MSGALALPAILLAATAALDMDVGVSAEGRGTRYAPEGEAATSRAAASTTPRATLILAEPTLRLSVGYTATFWSSDVRAQQSPLVSQTADGRLEARLDPRWTVLGSGSLLRGETDPLGTALLSSASTSAAQLASSGPIPYQRLHAEARAQVLVGPLTTATVGGRWDDARVLRGALSALMPPQQGAGVSADLSHRATELDTVSVRASGDWTETRLDGTTTGLSAATDATWRHAWSPRVDTWLRGGVGLAVTREPTTPAQRDLLPVGGAGLATAGGPGQPQGELTARLTSFVDRYTGTIRPVADAHLSLRWPVDPTLSLTADAAAGRRLDGVTTFVTAEARIGWAARPGLTFGAGVVTRVQRERQAGVPSFSETGVLVGATWATVRP
jgi:hypothetical protein